MAENSSVFQLTQLGIESTPGTPVAANKLLLDIAIRPDPEFEGEAFSPNGYVTPTAVIAKKEWGSAAIDGRLGYTSAPYLMCLGVKNVTPTAGTTDQTWTWKPSSNSEETIKTATIEYGSAVRAEKYAYAVLTALGITGNRDGLAVTGNMLMQRITDGITKTNSPSSVAADLVLATTGDVSIADTQAGLAGATPLDRVFEWGFNLSDLWIPVWPVRSTLTSFAATACGNAQKKTFKLKCAVESAVSGFLTKMRAGTKQWVRVKYTGDVVGSAVYTFQLDMCLGITSKPDNRDDVDSISTRGWTFDIIHDASWGGSYEMKVINALAAL